MGYFINFEIQDVSWQMYNMLGMLECQPTMQSQGSRPFDRKPDVQHQTNAARYASADKCNHSKP